MSNKIIVSKSGFNVLTETDPNNLVYSSAYNTLKYFLSGSLTCVVNVSANTPYSITNSVAHNLGYLPFYLTFANQPAFVGYQPVGVLLASGTFGTGTGKQRRLSSWVTSTHLFVKASGLDEADPVSYTATFFYKIFLNRLF